MMSIMLYYNRIIWFYFHANFRKLTWLMNKVENPVHSNCSTFTQRDIWVPYLRQTKNSQMIF